jgi:hypothetical protein
MTIRKFADDEHIIREVDEAVDAVLDNLTVSERRLVQHLLSAARASGCYMLASDSEWWLRFMRQQIAHAKSIKEAIQ